MIFNETNNPEIGECKRRCWQCNRCRWHQMHFLNIVLFPCSTYVQTRFFLINPTSNITKFPLNNKNGLGKKLKKKSTQQIEFQVPYAASPLINRIFCSSKNHHRSPKSWEESKEQCRSHLAVQWTLKKSRLNGLFSLLNMESQL